MRFPASFILLALAACSSGNSDRSGGVPTQAVGATRPSGCGEGDTQCLSDRYFAGYAEDKQKPCDLAPPTERIDGKLELALYAATTIDDTAVAEEGRLLQSYYARYGLTFVTSQGVHETKLATAMSGTEAELVQALKDGGIDPNAKSLTEAEKKRATAIVGGVVYGPLREFVRATSSPVQKHISVAVLEHVATAEIAKLAGLPEGAVIAGLGLSPKVFREIAGDDSSKNLFDAIGLPEDFTPVLFIGHTDIKAKAKAASVVVAHELGHCMGLQHTKIPGNLMTQYSASNACRPELDNDQLGIIREGVATDNATLVIDQAELVERLAKAPDAIVAKLFARP